MSGLKDVHEGESGLLGGHVVLFKVNRFDLNLSSKDLFPLWISKLIRMVTGCSFNE